MEQEQTTERKFTRFTKTQAGIGLFSIVFAIFFAGAVFSQEVIPQLQLQEYDSNVMNQIYGQSYFLNSLNGWTDQVTHYKGLLRASWEAAADNAIYDYVSSITTSDAYNDVNAYKDYVQKELDSQKLVAMNSWEDKANLDFLENRSEFVARLTTNQFDQAYIERTDVQQQYQQVLNENARVNQLQNNIVNAANNWNANFNQSYQTGLNDFSNTLSNIQDQYSDFLTNLNNSEATFQNNLSAIDSYKSVVKNAVKGVVGQFQGMLDEACSMDGCLYKYANGQFNDAGNTLNSLVGRLNTVLNSSTLDASDVLTTISAEIRTFLSVQSNSAYLTAIDYSKKVDTIQMGLNPSPYGTVDNSAYFTGIATGALGYSTAMHQSVWNGGLGAYSDLFVNVANADVKEVAKAIVFGGDAALKDYLEGRLGNGRTVSIIASNVYTDWAGGVHKNDPFAWIDVSGTQRDYRSDSNPWIWTAIRTGFTTDFQMGNIGVDLVYWMHDPVAQAHTSYWQGNYNSLGGQLNTYTNQISPAVRNWESQVASYNSFYEQWKVSADGLKAQAKIDYDNALADLEAKKSAWVQKMEEERQTSLIKWNELSNQAAAAESTADLQNINKQLSNTYNASISGLNISTNTNDLLNSYNGSLTDLGNRDFTFVEPTQIKDPIQDYQIVPKLELASLSVGALGNKIVSDQMVFGISNAIGISTLKQDPFVYSAMNNVSSALGGISSFLGGSSSTSTSQKFSIMNAASEKKVDTELTIDGKSLDEVFGKTTNGVYQYAQLLSMNENNSISATKEQEKLINQMAYQVTWDTRTAASLNQDGKLDLKVGSIGGFNNGELETLLTRLSKYDYKGPKFEGVCLTGALGYDDCTKKEKELTELQTTDYNKNFGTEIEKLKAAGYEIQGGKIVRSLSQEEKIRLGQVADTSTLTTEEKKLYGTCYVNPLSCGDLLKEEFKTEFNKETGVVKLSKLISNGQIDKKTDAGYISGTQNEIKYISLSQVKPVTAPVGKDLFDEWEKADWDVVDAQASTIMSDFYTKDLARDGKALSESTAVIRDTESKNEKKFQEAKTAQEASDSFLKDMLIAYISGGMAGIKASIKGKIEDQINSGIAAALVRATGGSEDQIAMATQLVSYMRGKIEEKKIKSNMAQNNLTNMAMGGLALMTGGASLLFSGAMGAMSGAIAGVGNMIGSAGAMLGATFGSSVASLGLGVTSTIYRGVAGDAAADAMMNRITGPKDQLAAIKANENAMIQSAATTAIATSTGLPLDLVGQMLTDYQGSQAAKKTRDAVNSNPMGVIGSQVAGLAGGIFKTAAVAFGAKERDIQEMLSDGNRMLYSGVTDSRMEAQSLAYLNQSFGMKAPGTSYTSNIPKDNTGIVEELGQRIVVEEIVKATGMNKDVANAAFRKQYGAIKQKKADKKAQSDAARSTAITAVTTLATLGAGGALGQTVLKGLTAIGAGSAQLGAAVINFGVQVVDGSRNGKEGMLAGFTNGAIGLIGAKVQIPIGDKLSALTDEISTGLTKSLSPLLDKSLLGLGVSYNPQAGWGGMIGLGGAKANVSISFSQRGDTTISGSANTGIKGLQVTASTTTNGATSIGANYNPSDKGPRQGWNLGANYDINGGGFSGTVGYTNPNTGMGVTSNIDRNGVSTSLQVNGVNLASSGPDGFRYDEMNWAEQNINRAQDATDRNRDNSKLIADGVTDPEKMSDQERADRLGEIQKAEDMQALEDSRRYSLEELAEFNENPLAREAALDDVNGVVDPERLAALALTTVGTAIAGAVAFVGLGGRTNNTPTNSQPTDIVTPARRRKDGEEGPLDILVEGVTDLGRMVSDWWNDTPAINPLVASKADAALVAAAVYSDVPMDKKLELLGKSENPFKILGPDDFRGTPLAEMRFVDSQSGLDSMLVKRTTIIDGQTRTVYVYALAGTEGGVFSNDGATNASAVVGMSDQYELALYNAKKIQEYLKKEDPTAILMTTGHSLGGGMAASISLQTGIPAITFNPAGTNFLTNGISNAFNTGWNQIDAYITPTDPVNAAQRLLFPLIGANGRTHTETILTPSGIFDGHSINNFVDHYFSNTTNPIPKDTVVRQPEDLNHFINEDGALDINRLNNELNLTTPERERVLRLNEELREAERTLERSSLLADNNSNINIVKWEEAKKNLAKVKENLNSLIKNTAMGFGYSPTANVITASKPEITARPLNVSEVSNSSVDLQQRFVEAAELPNVNDFKKGGSLKLKFPEDTSPEKIHETLEKVGTQMIKDAYFNYDASIKSKDLLEKFAKENGLNSPNATNEQKQIYQKLQTELNTAIANSKADPLKARIDYTRENYARITTETLVNRYGDKIDTESSTARVTVLKDGEGMILNQVAYDSQRDNTSKIEFSDYVLYPGNECSPTATSIAAEYMGATSQNGMYQFVDDFIKQAHNDGILSDGDELKKDKYLTKVLAKYDQKLVPLKVDLIPKPGTNPVKYESDSAGWKTDSIKVALNEGKPVVVGGEFNVSPVIGGHRLVIVGYDSTGWIVHDPYGNANNSGYQGSGMYAHYDYGKWDIGKTPTAFVIENIPKKE